jgi:hypothetical protein
VPCLDKPNGQPQDATTEPVAVTTEEAMVQQPVVELREPIRGRRPCRYLKEPAGMAAVRLRDRVELPLMSCVVHGECTVAEKIVGVACCSVCPDWLRDMH